MYARLRSLLIKTPVRIVLGLLVAYLLFAWFGFEPLVKWAAPKYLADKSRHTLTLDAAKFDPIALSLRLNGLKLAEPDGKPLLAFDELFVDFEASSLFRWTYRFDSIRLVAPHARLALLADGSLNWSALLEALKSEDDEADEPLPRLQIRRISLERGRLDLADRKVAGGFEVRLDPLSLSLADLSTLPDDKGAYSVVATTQLGARIRWKGDVSLNPIQASGELAIERQELARLWPYLRTGLAMAPPEGVAALALNYRVGYADKRLSLLLDRLGITLEGLALRGVEATEAAVKLDRVALSGGRFDLEKRTLDLGEIALQGGRLRLARDRAGRLDIEDWFVARTAKPVTEPEARSASAAAGPARPVAPGGAEAAPWRINLGRFALDGVAVRFSDAGFATPLIAELANLRVAFAAQAEAGGAQSRALVENLAVDLSGIRLLSGSAPAPLLVLGGATLEGGRIDLVARQIEVAKLALLNGKVEALRDANGRIALLEALQPSTGQTAAGASAKPAAEAAAAWHYRVGQIGLSGFQFGARDETVQPAAGLTLERIEATVAGVSDDLKAALPVKLAFHIKQGGRFQAEGKVIPAHRRGEVKLKLADLALAPAQPYLAQAANLVLASGRASSQGLVKFDGKAAAAGRVSFKGGFEVADLLLKESEGGDRFLAWKHLRSDSVRATPAALEIDELKLDGLGAKLIIYQDKTTNLKNILKTAPAPEAIVSSASANSRGKAAANAGRGQASSQAKPAAPSFRLDIDRVRVEHGEVDFADLSLLLPFGARIHDFKGAFNGISSQPGTAAELELDGRVDEFGLARAVGRIDLFNPTGFMDIKMVFRNVEMTRLTPYTATFAGYKIASGKLSLDLEYKIKNRELLGENQIIMDRLTLGEKLEGPNIKHLPLELAIAILQDADGRIDLGLPVSGSLDDPQFSYGRIIWKAIGNILGKIVTAPFRALGALFGGGGEKLEQVVFEAGEAALTPPELEKFKQISLILNKRPGLSLTVKGAWSAEIDRPVMRETRLRRAVAENMGIKLAAGEDPGPISTANPRIQAALEALYAARFGETEWKTLSVKWRQANPDRKSESGAGKLMSRLTGLFRQEAPLSADDLAQLKDADLHALLYGRLLAQETVSDADLQALAGQRAQAVVAALAAAGAPGERVAAGGIDRHQGDGREVPAKLELGVARRP